MESINTFQGGMNKDISKSLYKEGSYIHAENFTLVTDLGLSTGSLRNINGNEKFVDIPNCSNVISITNITASPVTINIPTISYSTTYVASNTVQLGLAMQADINLSGNSIGVAYTDTQVVVYSLLFDNNLVHNSITVTATNATVNTLVPAITNPKIIGWGTIRDEIILYTANNSLAAPVNQTGQIWKLTYDKYSFNPILTLLYNGYLNFSLSNPIPNPGGFVGNFETPKIQKIYWTDNYNRPRTLNIADPNSMALPIDMLDSTASAIKTVATIFKIEDVGNIPTGIYQVSARLVQTTGTSGSFVTPSNSITIISEKETAPYVRYEARNPGTVVPKSISARLYNLDTTYDRVEPVIIYREDPNATPDIYILPSQPIPNNGILEFTYTGNETTIPISLEEFIAEGIVFDTVKSMVSKYNMLFFGNVKYSDFDVDFDCRAYRFSGLNSTSPRQAVLTGSTSYTINGTAPNWSAIPEDADAIQNLSAQAPDSTNNYLFQADGQTFGGQGPNISYEFVPMYSVNDRTINSQYRTLIDDSNKSGSIPTPYASVNKITKTTNFNLDTPPQTGYTEAQQSTSFGNAAGPFGSYTVKGYQRDEMYRFGIVFFSKKGQPSYVHHIADIRMPKVYMPSVTSANADNRDYLAFPISSVDNANAPVNSNVTSGITSGICYGNNLGIKFTVNNLNLISDQISGYAIVRVAREDKDKTILGQGIFNPIWFSGNLLVDGNRYWAISPGTTWQEQTFNNSGTAVFDHTVATLASPEFLFKDPPSYSTNDEIDIIQASKATTNFSMFDGTNTATSSLSYKFYTAWESAAAPKIVTSTTLNTQGTPINFCETRLINPGETVNSGLLNITTQLHNYGWTGALRAFPFEFEGPEQDCTGCPGANSNGWVSRGVGGSRLYLGFGFCSSQRPNALNTLAQAWANNPASRWTDLIYADFITQSSSILNIYLANYRRPVTVQYGGNTYSERSYNEYISTGHVQIVNPGDTSHTDMVFGGDTYISLFDYADQLRNSALNGYSGPSSGTESVRYSKTRNTIFLVPVECSFPIELRKNNEPPANTVDDGYTDPNFVRCAPNKASVYLSLPKFITGSLTAPYTTAEWTENFDIDLSYFADNDIVKFFPKPDPFVGQDVFDVRIHRSQTKTNGELTDSWGIFKPEDYIDLDTIQGPLNNLIIHQDRLVSFQDKGVALVSVNERSLTQDISGSEIVLGTGGVLARYDYISKIIGSRHQFSFVTSHDAVFWFDMNTKNMYKMQGNSPSAITVAKGLSSFFSNNLDGLIQVNDNPYLNKGITSTYDFRYNEAIMTFRDSVVDTSKSATGKGVTFTPPTTYDFNINPSPIWMSPGTDVLVTVKNTGESYPGVVIAGGIISIPEAPLITSTDTVIIYPYTRNSFTIAYNDLIDAYTSFYSYTPPVYINDQVSIFSPAEDYKTIYRHDVGDHGVFYDAAPVPSKLKLIVNQFATETKVFDNYEVVSESIDLSNGANIATDFFDRIRLYNDYQNTDFQTLPIDTLSNKQIAKRKERTWNLSNLRNRVLYISGTSPNIFSNGELSTYTISNPQTAFGDKVFGERMRDKYLLVDLEYDNLQNYRFIMHTFKSHFRKSAR